MRRWPYAVLPLGEAVRSPDTLPPELHTKVRKLPGADKREEIDIPGRAELRKRASMVLARIVQCGNDASAWEMLFEQL